MGLKETKEKWEDLTPNRQFLPLDCWVPRRLPWRPKRIFRLTDPLSSLPTVPVLPAIQFQMSFRFPEIRWMIPILIRTPRDPVTAVRKGIKENETSRKAEKPQIRSPISCLMLRLLLKSWSRICLIIKWLVIIFLALFPIIIGCSNQHGVNYTISVGSIRIYEWGWK